jgi:hypothetical protein
MSPPRSPPTGTSSKGPTGRTRYRAVSPTRDRRPPPETIGASRKNWNHGIPCLPKSLGLRRRPVPLPGRPRPGRTESCKRWHCTTSLGPLLRLVEGQGVATKARRTHLRQLPPPPTTREYPPTGRVPQVPARPSSIFGRNR